MKKILVRIIEVILVLIIISQVYIIFQKQTALKKTENASRELLDIADINPKSFNEIEADYIKDKINTDVVKKYAEKNPDTVGLIYIPGTKILYPVVQGADNEYYLNHDIDKKYNVFGEVFMDYRNSRDFTDDNIIFYGHNVAVKNEVFSELLNYENYDFYKSHRIIYFVTNDSIRKYNVVASYIVDPAEKYRVINFADDNEKNSYINHVKEISLIGDNIKDSEVKQFLTLSTCKEHVRRMVVQAVYERDI